MRFSAAFLLVLLLPGLLLPAGLVLRWCRCEQPMTNVGTASCCTPAPAPASTCCTCACTATSTADDDCAADADRGIGCRCTWIRTPDTKPEPLPPVWPVPIQLPPSAPSVAPSVAPRVARCAPADVVACRPPPDHERCLPLLL